jgi:NO-binding membrane sensor protein with MHYT domain
VRRLQCKWIPLLMLASVCAVCAAFASLQVLSRVHRYGQKQQKHVTFLVAKGSINKLLHDR